MSDDASNESSGSGGGDSKPTANHSSGTFILLILAVVAGIAAAAWFLKPPKPPFNPGEKLEALFLTSLAEDGDAVTLDDLKGKVVLLNFWGTWCPPCVKEYPEMVALQKQYQGRDDFRLLAVSCGVDSDTETELPDLRTQTQSFIDKRDGDMPIYLDPDFKTRTSVQKAVGWQAAGWQGYPTTLLLDREHRVQRIWVGGATKSQFESAIEELLNKK